jgi:NAD(P)-dependent dehydrogenase (short-subunit alcohol dehydrogenase family)
MADQDRPIALVSGSSRGVGAGIARALGEAGCVVYITGRSARGNVDPKAPPGTIEETADAVTKAGGQGIAVRCDHRDEKQIADLMARIGRDHRRLDILVNNAWAGYENHGGEGAFAQPFMALSTAFWTDMFDGGLKPTFLTTRHALPLMTVPKKPDDGARLIVNTVAWAFDEYLGNLWYDVAKAASIRMVQGLARELAGADIAVVALAPGFVRTERVEAALKGNEAALASTESSAYVGRAVVALAGDPDLMDKTGKLLTAGELAREFSFTDFDGKQPAPFRFT